MSTGRKFRLSQLQISASDPNNSVWVSANAGTGKTQVLVDRIIRLLLNGVLPQTILCLTFTKAAAAEMAGRLFSKLADWAAISDTMLAETLNDLGEKSNQESILRARRLFAEVLETPGGLKIQTIHGFSEKLLHLFPVEAGLAPGFIVMDEQASRQLRDDAISQILSETAPETQKAVELTSMYAGGLERLSELVIKYIDAISGEDQVWLQQFSRGSIEATLKARIGLATDRISTSVLDEIENVDKDDWRRLFRAFQPHGKFDGRELGELLLNVAESAGPFEPLKTLFLTEKGEPLKRLISKDVRIAEPVAVAELYAKQEVFHRLFCEYESLQRIEATGALFQIARGVKERILFEKARRGMCDFDDLISFASRLVSTRNSTAWVLYKLDQGLNHILVDEAQDTSPAQWNIVRALAEEFFAGEGSPQKVERTMFVVGDKKQSIYSFQGADIAAFGQMREFLTAKITAKGNRFQEVMLGLSYRSAQEILDAVDAVFPVADLSHIGVLASDVTEAPHSAAVKERKGIVELWPLEIDEETTHEDQSPWGHPNKILEKSTHRRCLARKIAETLHNWIGSRLLIGENRCIEPGDILILLQSRSGLFPILMAELRRLGLPVAGADRLTLQKNLAVKDLLALAQWCILPSDDYSLACVLKSPLVPFSMNEEELFQIASGRQGKSIWDLLIDQGTENGYFLEKISSTSLSSSPAEFIHGVLNLARLRISERLGSEALEAVDAFLDTAYEFEEKHHGGLSSFLNWFEASEITLKREMEQSSGEIRMMSVHAAKGLEANVVILPDAADAPRGINKIDLLRTDNSQIEFPIVMWNIGGLARHENLHAWLQEEKEKILQEHGRLLYVAMTRAKNELYITGSCKNDSAPETSWWRRLEKSLGPKYLTSPTLVKVEPASALAEKSSAPSPDWLFEPVSQKINIKNAGNRMTSQSSDVAYGTALHKLMEVLVDMPPELRHGHADNLAGQLNIKVAVVKKLIRLFELPELDIFWTAEGRSEVELWSADSTIHRVDRLVVRDDHVLVLDYKSGNSNSFASSPDHPYVRQMARYSAILTKIYPNRTIKPAILWLEEARLEWIPTGLLDDGPDRSYL